MFNRSNGLSTENIKTTVFYGDLARELGWNSFSEMMDKKDKISKKLKKAIDIICKTTGRPPLFKNYLNLSSSIFI